MGDPVQFKLVRGADEHILPPGTWVVGSTSSAAIRFEDASVSQRHALLRVGDVYVDIIDLGSECGTFLNGCPVTGLVRGASGGDRLMFGEVECDLRGPGPARPEPVPAGGETPTREVDTRAVVARLALVRAKLDALPAPGARRPETETETAPEAAAERLSDDERPSPPDRSAALGPPHPRLILALADRAWAEQIARAASIHRNLRVEILAPELIELTARRDGPGVLVLDLDLAGDRAAALIAAWRAGRDVPERAALLTGRPGPGRGVRLAQELGARTWVRRGKPSILVIALARLELDAYGAADGSPDPEAAASAPVGPEEKRAGAWEAGGPGN